MDESLRIEISLASPGEWRVVERSHLAAENVSRILFKESELSDLLAELNQCLLDANVNMEIQRVRLRRLGGRLAEIVLPGTLRDKMLSAVGSVEFFLDDASILLPVELFPHGDTVLAEALPVSRHWFCENAASLPRKHSDKGKQALIVADPAENLPGARKEGEELFRKLRTLGKGWHCRYLGRAVTTTELSKELPDTDLLHLAAHYVSEDSETASGVAMADGIWMPSPASHTPELVFVNCCRAGLTSTGNGNLSLVGKFLQRGSRHVIAPFLPASDNMGRLFAGAFYQSLFSGKGVTHAIWEARKATGPASWGYWYFGAVSNVPDVYIKKRGAKFILALMGVVVTVVALGLYIRSQFSPSVESVLQSPSAESEKAAVVGKPVATAQQSPTPTEIHASVKPADVILEGMSKKSTPKSLVRVAPDIDKDF